MLTPELIWAISGLGALLLAILIWLRFFRRRPTPEEIERMRRQAINLRGKIGDGEVLDVEGVAVIYAYTVGGVGYEAAQDVSALEKFLRSDLMSIIGPVAVKYDPRNPANSIVLCETWNGLRG